MQAKWITATPASHKTSLYIFQKTFRLEKEVLRFPVRISADTRYKLYVNGKEMAQGPCKSSRFVKYYEELDCAEALMLGENEIKILVLHIAPQDGNFFTTAYHREKVALYFDGLLETQDGAEQIVSDESFSVSRAAHIAFTYHINAQCSMAPFEIIDNDQRLEALNCSVLYTPHPENHHYTSWGLEEDYLLQKSPIQVLQRKPEKSLQIVREYYDENGNYNIILDAGAYTTAMLNYAFSAPKGTKINLIYSECPLTRAEDGSLYKGMRDNADGVIGYGVVYPDHYLDHYDEVIASGNKQVFEPFFYRAFRFIRVECSAKPMYFQASAARYTYDFEMDAVAGGVGSFVCSDEKYAKLWQITQNTLECCTHETVVDCPFYEQQQYIGDGRFASLPLWRLSNDSKIQRKLLLDTAHSLQPDGQVATTAPNMWTQIIHISTLYFVNLIREYLRYTGDVDFVKTMIGVIGCNVGYFEREKTPQGLFNPSYGCRFIDWVASWKKGHPQGGENAPITVHSLMYAAMLQDAAEICDICGYPGTALDYRNLYQQMIDAVNKHCFDTEMGLYADVPGQKTYSEHTTVWAILSGAVTGDAARALAERTMDCDLVEPSSFSKKYDLLRALDKVGLYQRYAPEILKLWDEMLDKHCTTWCESTSYPRSECHGWSCTPMYEMSAQILGVYPVENGFQKVRIKPYCMGLSYAKGRVPTPFGYIDVAWTQENERFSLTVNSNKEIQMEIVLPSGNVQTVFADHFTVTE